MMLSSLQVPPPTEKIVSAEFCASELALASLALVQSCQAEEATLPHEYVGVDKHEGGSCQCSILRSSGRIGRELGVTRDE